MPTRILAVGLTALSGSCASGAYADEPAKPPETAAAASAQLMQLCKIDMKGDKKDQWMRLAEGGELRHTASHHRRGR